MMYINKRTGNMIEIIAENDKTKTVMIRDMETGKTSDICISTLKRWYVKQEPQEPEQMQEPQEPEQEPKKKERRPRQKKEMVPDIKNLHEYVLSVCTELGGIVFVPAKEMKFRGLKAGKHMFIKYHWTNTSVILQVRATALGLDAPKNPANHTFNDKYVFTEDTAENRKEIYRIMKTCYDWQVAKNETKKK